MNGQSRKHSAFESVLNVLIGYWVALMAQAFIFPLYGVHLAPVEHGQIAGLFTVVSLVRSYVLRRMFNWWHVRSLP